MSVRDKLIVALDVDNLAEARGLVNQLGDRVSHYKIGYRLLYQPGVLEWVRHLSTCAGVMLDAKLHDIPSVVEAGARNLAYLGVKFITVHGYPKTIAAAKAGVVGTSAQVLAVTVLTSYVDDDMQSAGYSMGVRELVLKRAKQASLLGAGVVCSAEELSSLRSRLPHGILVVPGIRLSSDDGPSDQKRKGTPNGAIKDGADFIVVGRPIIADPNPLNAVRRIVDAMTLGCIE